MKERLLEFIAHLGVSVKEFERSCGRPNGFVNNLRDNMSVKTLGEVSARYPSLNTAWLITGEGEMIRKGDREEELLRRIAELSDLLDSYREVNRQQNATIAALTAMLGKGGEDA